MKIQQIVFVFSVFILVGFSSVNAALKCYSCNSHNDSRCADPIPPESLQTVCLDKSTMCRKTVQSIEFAMNGLPPETRTIRTCGYDESNYKGRCYQRSGYGERQEVCSCLTSLCNGATPRNSHVPHTLVALCFLGSVLTAYARY